MSFKASYLLLVGSLGAAACATTGTLFTQDDGGAPPDASGVDGLSFADGPTGATFDVDPAVEQDITVAFGQSTPTVGFAASSQGSPLAVAWNVDRGEVGSVTPSPSTTTTFTPSGTTGGLVDVLATYDKQTVARQVLVKLTGSQNGATTQESGQVATSVNQLTAGGGIGGVGGEGLGGPVTDTATLTALGSPTNNGTAQGLAFIYPYDKTVWARGLLAPLLMWSSSIGDADAIKIDLTTTSGSFTWSGTFARPAILQQTGGSFIRCPIPQDVWQMATDTAGGLIHNTRDQLIVSLTIAKSGQGYGPIKQTWDVAQGRLKGTVYYNSYGTRYSTSNWSNVVGASTLAIKHGATDPYLVTSKTACQVCHSVAAKGSDLVTEQDPYPGNGQDYDVYYDLKTPTPPGSNLPPVDGLFTWGAITPDGALLFTNSSATWPGNNGLEGASTTASGIYTLPSGTSVVTPAQIASQLSLSTQLGGSLPSFSPDGKHIAFTFFQGGPGGDGKSGDGKSLAVVDFDQSTKTFSNLRTIYTPTCAGCTAVWSFFTPTNDALVFELNTKSNGLFAGTSAMQGSTTSQCSGLSGAHGELWWVDLATKTAHRLDVLNGTGYLPTLPSSDHTDDTALQFEPSVAPIVSGGYMWIAFMSRRLYGSVATLNPWCSDTQSMTFTQPMTKKLWVAAFDLNATPGTDPSHPAFYLPAQELLAGNFRSFWVLDPCEADGTTCETGDQCCGGYCESSTDGGLVCGSTPQGCGGEGDTCSGATCCSGLTCAGGHCDVIPIK